MATSTAADLVSARLLAGLTQAQLAQLAGVGLRSIIRIEATGHAPSAEPAILDALGRAGVTIHGPGDVRHLDGREAPTRRKIGRLRGERIRRARKRIGWTLGRLAGASGISLDVVRQLEASPDVLNERPTRTVWAVVGALQLGGCYFAPRNRDAALVARPERLPLDWSPRKLRGKPRIKDNLSHS